MAQQFRTIRANSLEEAGKIIKRELGENATVVRVRDAQRKGLRGLFSKPGVEVTVAIPEDRNKGATTRKKTLSPVERRYTQTSTKVGSDELFFKTIEHFQGELASQGRQKTKSAPAARIPGSTPLANRAGKVAPAAQPLTAGRPLGNTVPRTAPAPTPSPTPGTSPGVLNFPRTASPRSAIEALQEELKGIRQSLNVLMAENPGRGFPPEATLLYQVLVERGVTQKLAAALLMKVMHQVPEREIRDERILADRLWKELRRQLKTTGGITLAPGYCKRVALVGTTGVGKTTTIAKLAARYALRENARVALITADTYRVAAPQQLKVYADIIELPMIIVNDPDEMKKAVHTFRDYDLVLIDTAGASQYNVRQLHELRDILRVARPVETHLILSPGLELDDLQHVIENFQCLKPKALIFSKLDETRKFGTMLSVMAETALPVSYLTHGQEVPNDIWIARPELLADLIIEGKKKRA